MIKQLKRGETVKIYYNLSSIHAIDSQEIIPIHYWKKSKHRQGKIRIDFWFQIDNEWYWGYQIGCFSSIGRARKIKKLPRFLKESIYGEYMEQTLEIKTMKRVKVKSSNIASIGYDSSRNILQCEFTSGKVYNYFDVPQVVVDELFAAPSIGSYHRKNIAYGYRYQLEDITGDQL